MNAGYIYLETRPDYPGVIRVKVSSTEPVIPQDKDGSNIEYIARFYDLDAARLHLHNALRHEVENLEFHTYRASLDKAVAVLEADGLRHHRVWIAPQLAAENLVQIERLAANMQDKNRLRDRIWQTVGWLGIAWVVLLLFLL